MQFVKENKDFKITIDNVDDLYYLTRILEKKDTLNAVISRKIKVGENTIRKKFRVDLEIEELELQESSLRINGIILTEHEDLPLRSYQGLSLSVKDTFIIKNKKFREYHFEKIKQSQSKEISILLCIVDRYLIYFYLINKISTKLLDKIIINSEKKNPLHQASKNYKQEISKLIEDMKNKLNPEKIIISSTAFFLNNFKTSYPKIKINSVNDTSIKEILRNENVTKLIKDNQEHIQNKLIEELKYDLSKDMATYTEKDVTNQLNSGNAKVLLISTEFVKKSRLSDGNLENILNLAESLNCEIHILESENEYGKTLDSLKGIALIKRF